MFKTSSFVLIGSVTAFDLPQCPPQGCPLKLHSTPLSTKVKSIFTKSDDKLTKEELKLKKEFQKRQNELQKRKVVSLEEEQKLIEQFETERKTKEDGGEPTIVLHNIFPIIFLNFY